MLNLFVSVNVKIQSKGYNECHKIFIDIWNKLSQNTTNATQLCVNCLFLGFIDEMCKKNSLKILFC